MSKFINMGKTDRHLDLSAKFIEMGQSLITEGRKNKDFMVASPGTILVLLGSLMYDEKDLNFFSQVCSMFSAKKILENMEENNHDYTTYLKDKSIDESYDDFIKRINKLREDNGNQPIGE